MLKKLQLYTICIVVIVIVLAQFTLFSDSDMTTTSSESTQVSQEGKTKKTLEAIDDSKYDQPIGEIEKAYNKFGKSVSDVKRNIEGVKELLDVQKNLEEFAKSFEN